MMMVMRSSALCCLLMLACFLSVSVSYHIGGDEIMCWQTDMSTGSQVLLDACPPSITLVWLEAPPATVPVNQPVSATYRLQIAAPLAARLYTEGVDHIPHANVHSCRVSAGFCTPNVGETADLVSHSQELSSDATFQNDLWTVDFTSEYAYDFGSWTSIAHVRFFLDSDTNGTKFDVAHAQIVSAVEEDKEVDEIIVIIVNIIVSIIIAVFLAAMVATIFNREHLVIRYSSPPFLVAILLGAIISLSSVYFWHRTSTVFCNLRVWLLCTGFILLFGSLYSKTWRVYKILNNKKLKVLNYSTGFLMRIVAGFVVAEFVLLALYTAFAMPSKAVLEVTGSPGVNYVTCGPRADYEDSTSETMKILGVASLVLLLVVNALSMIIGAILSYQTRKTFTLLNESKWISLTLYSVVVLSSLLIPISIATAQDPNSLYLLQTVGIMLIMASSIGFLFVPKFRFVFNKNASQIVSLQEEMTGSTIRTSAGKNGGVAEDGVLTSDFAETLKELRASADKILSKYQSGIKLKSDALEKLKDHIDTAAAALSTNKTPSTFNGATGSRANTFRTIDSATAQISSTISSTSASRSHNSPEVSISSDSGSLVGGGPVGSSTGSDSESGSLVGGGL
eukprot:TRINITY_DN1648_c0_g1_i1.p1 TRINITY_DN1648_c0_g1~~TRINITY_DN1648_c0_g1_i1.p1  ORF type:complete len:621 (+),score=145.22 TRINITY_DN1648_c0_g1_i1:61-1923(+)